MSKDNLLGKESLAQKMEKLKQEMNMKNSTTKHKSSKQHDPAETNKIKNQQKGKITPKLFVSGRLDRKKHTYVAKSLILMTELENEIKAYCKGGDLAILNYLIKEGLRKVKMSNTPINVDIEDLENDIT